MDQVAKVGTLIKISLLGQKQTTRFLEVNNKRIEKQQPRLYKISFSRYTGGSSFNPPLSIIFHPFHDSSKKSRAFQKKIHPAFVPGFLLEDCVAL